MRVLYVANYQSPALVKKRAIVRNRSLGASRKIELFSKALASRGHDITILSAGTVAERTGIFYTSMDEIMDGRISAHFLPAVDLPILNSKVGGWFTRRWMRTNPVPDIAIVYNLSKEDVRTGELLSKMQVPVVYEYEDDATATLEKGAGGNPSGEYWVRKARAHARGAIAVNRELAHAFNHENSEVIEGVVEDGWFKLPRRSYDGREPLRILYAGGLTTPKGIDLLLGAVAGLGIDYVLTITGTGPLRGLVEAEAKANRRIRYMGELSRELLFDQFSSSHIAVNPHRTDGGQIGTLFPFKIAEYLASGAAVISSPLGEMDEVVRDGIVMYPTDDRVSLTVAIEKVAREYGHWSSKAEKARQQVHHELCSSAIGERIEAVLKRAVIAK